MKEIRYPFNAPFNDYNNDKRLQQARVSIEYKL